MENNQTPERSGKPKGQMKKALEKKLLESERNFKYFWRKEIKEQINITYAHFMNMLNKDAAMRADVNNLIIKYLGE